MSNPTAGGEGGHKDPLTAGGTDAAKATYTRAELDAMFADVRRGATEAGTKKALTDLGFDSIEEARKAVDEGKALKTKQMTDAERIAAEKKDLEDKLAQERQRAKDATSSANTKLMRIHVITEAQKAGVDPSEFESVWKEIRDDAELRGQIKPKGEDEFEGAAAAILKVIEKHPRWLANAQGMAGDGVGTTRVAGARREQITQDAKQKVENTLRATGQYRG